jgi:membrane fusion protein (multidrug efflux system)
MLVPCLGPLFAVRSRRPVLESAMRPFTPAASLFLVALLAACGDKPQPPAAGPSEVSVMRIEPRETPVTFEFTAQTESSQLVEIRTRVSGFLDRRSYKEGSLVDAGQTLFQIDRKPFEAQLAAARGELAAQQARLDVAQATLARVKPLVAQNALSKKDLDDAVGNERAAAAAVEIARANVLSAELNLGYTTIKSPIKGLASFAEVQEGSYLNANSQEALLTTVAALHPMRVNFSVSENDILGYRDKLARGIMKVPPQDRFEVEIVLADGSTFPHVGRITFADTSFSQGTGTMMLRAEVANPQGVLVPGQFVRARLIGASYPQGIVIPQRAVQQSGQGTFVWVVDAQNTARPRPVKVGQWVGEQWLVLEGLKAGDTLVTDGVLRLAPGAPVKVVPAPIATAPAAGK